jgi:hypothetical protein
MVEESLIKFRKEQIELGLVASCCKAIHLMHTIHPEKAIGGVTFAMFGLTSIRVKYMRAHMRFRKSAHELNAKLNRGKAKFLDTTSANHAFQQCILCAPIEANPSL